VISWHTPRKCVRVLIGTMSIPLSKDNHDSWKICITSTECKTIITVMLMVMSGMDPHMISGTWDELLVKSFIGLCQVGLLGCGSVTVRLCDAIKIVIFEGMSLLPYY
jgi:hypothetical protein